MTYLVDTNVLLRLVQKDSSMHINARQAFITLRQQGIKLCIVPQTVIEFWVVATRPVTVNGWSLD